MQAVTAPRLLFVGRLAPQKGVHTTLSALEYLRQYFPDLHPTLTIVGSGHQTYTTQLRTLASQSGCEKLVDFVAAVRTQEVPSLMVEHDILLVPSVWDEPFGRVVVEGMAAGLPVVGTATGGSGEILVDGLNGLTFPVEDEKALAQCIIRLVQNPDLYAQLSIAAKETSLKFDLINMVDGIECYLHEVAAANGELEVVC
jgi:glycosyltransferase involved in cell wall biosynthesis